MAANPYGFAPISTLTGAPWNGQARQYAIDYTTSGVAYPINAGDPVVVLASGGIGVAQTIPNPYLIGVAIGFTYKLVGSTEVSNTTYFPGYSAAIAYDPSVPPVANVVDDPNVLYSIGVNGVNSLLLSDVGSNMNYVLPGAPVTTGTSGVLLNYAPGQTAGTVQLRIMGLAPNSVNTTDAQGNTYLVPNAYGIPNNNALVLFNVHAYKSVGTLGI